MHSHTGRSLLTKQSLSPEEERAVRQFFEGFGEAVDPIADDLVAALEAGEIDVSTTTAVQARVEQIVGRYTADVRVAYREGLTAGATAGREVAARRHQLDIVTDRVPARTIEALEDWAFEATDEVLGRMEGDITQFLQSAQSEGLSISEIASDLESDFFEGRVKDWEARRVARTETIGSSNAGAHSGHEDADSVTGEEWLATLDGRERDDHSAMDGVVVGVEEAFTLPDGSSAQFPGAPGLPVGQRANCRCTVIPTYD